MEWFELVRYTDEGWGKWKYNCHMERAYGAIASGYAIWILSLLNEIENICSEDRANAIAFFQSCQDPDSGFFMDPLITEADLKGNGHTWEAVKVQMTDIKYGLDYLGAKPKYELPAKNFADLWAVDVKKWVLSLDWKNPWLAGWQWDQCLQAFSNSEGVGLDVDKNKRVDVAFKIFEEYIMDPVTGLPLKQGCKDLSVGMAGLFKVLFAYKKFCRELPYPDKAIDSVLSLQDSSGEFGEGADMCINWDSVWVLRELDQKIEGSYKRRDISNAMEKLAECLLREYRKFDGGFAFHRDFCLQYHMSVHISNPLQEGDMLGTLQSLFCLQYADEYSGLVNVSV